MKIYLLYYKNDQEMIFIFDLTHCVHSYFGGVMARSRVVSIFERAGAWAWKLEYTYCYNNIFITVFIGYC